MNEAVGDTLTLYELERQLWADFQRLVAESDEMLLQHREAVDRHQAAARRWMEAFRRLGGV